MDATNHEHVCLCGRLFYCPGTMASCLQRKDARPPACKRCRTERAIRARVAQWPGSKRPAA